MKIIIIAVVIIIMIVIIYFVVMLKKGKAEAKRQIDDFVSRNPTKILTEKQKHNLLYGAILFKNTFESPLDFFPEMRIDQYAYTLKDSWGIANTEQAKETLDELLSLKTSIKLDAFISDNDISVEQDEIAKQLELSIDKVKEVTTTYAWDLNRAILVAEWCYFCEYITYDEAWSYINKAAAMAVERGKDWSDYTISLCLGRMLHGFGLDDTLVNGIQKLFTSSNPSESLFKVYKFK